MRMCKLKIRGGRTARRRRSRSRGHCVSDAPPSPPSASASFCTVNKHSRSCWELLTLGELIVFGGTCRDCVRHRGQLQLRPQRRYLLHTSMSQQKHPAMPAVDSETGRWAYDCSSGASRLLPAFGCVRSCLQKYPPVSDRRFPNLKNEISSLPAAPEGCSGAFTPRRSTTSSCRYAVGGGEGSHARGRSSGSCASRWSMTTRAKLLRANALPAVNQR